MYEYVVDTTRLAVGIKSHVFALGGNSYGFGKVIEILVVELCRSHHNL